MAVESKQVQSEQFKVSDKSPEPVVTQQTKPVPSEDTGTSSVEPVETADVEAVADEAQVYPDVSVKSVLENDAVVSVAGNDYEFAAGQARDIPADKAALIVEIGVGEYA